MARTKDSLLSSILRVTFIFAAAVVFLLIVFFILMRIAISGNEVAVPNVIGKSLTEASRVLNENRLRSPIIEGYKYSGELPKDYVIEQRPEPGQKVKSGREIKVYLSKGAEAGIVPRVIGKSVLEAQSVLKTSGLEVGYIVRVHSDDFPQEGIVIAHTPAANATVQRGSKVNLLVSLGPYYVLTTVPDLRGMKLQNAAELLKSSGLRLGQVKRQVSLEVKESGIVLEQNPQPNDRVRKGIEVNVVVSSLSSEL